MEPGDLSTAERRLWTAFPRGVRVDLRDESDPDARVVRADVIKLLLLGAQDAEPGHLAALRVSGARITGSLALAYAQIDVAVSFHHCEFEHGLDLYGSRLRQLSIFTSTFPGFIASTAVIDGNLRLTGSRSTAEIRLVGTRITGALLLNGAHLTGAPVALDGRRLTVANDILGRNGLRCDGEIRFNNAEIGGALRLEGAQLHHPGATALFAPDLVVGGIANLCDGFRADGKISLSYARIGSNLCFRDAVLSQPDGVVLDLRHAQAGELRLETAKPITGLVDLSHATIGVLRDAQATWPTQLRLDGMSYEAVVTTDPDIDRTTWLRRDPQGYRPQAYEQLAAVYRRLGREREARAMLLANQRHRREQLGAMSRLWGYLQDLTVGYGYRPAIAMGWLAGLLALGTGVFWSRPPAFTGDGVAPDFNPFFYTLDLLLPLVDFGQERAFTPRGPLTWLAFVIIAAGWVLATTVAAGATRALHRE